MVKIVRNSIFLGFLTLSLCIFIQTNNAEGKPKCSPKTYWENGKIRREECLDEGGLRIRKEYTFEGELLSEETTQGFSSYERVYYPNGKIRYEKSLSGDGPFREYDRKGNLLMETIYKNGKVIGFTKTYYDASKGLGVGWAEIPYRILDLSKPQYVDVKAFEQKYKNLVIDSKEELNNFLSGIYQDFTKTEERFSKQVTQWQELIPENVDFKKYTILANFTSGGSSNWTRRKVLRSDNQKSVKYFIEFVPKLGELKEEDYFEPILTNWFVYDFNLIIIDKVPKDYKIEFEVD